MYAASLLKVYFTIQGEHKMDCASTVNGMVFRFYYRNTMSTMFSKADADYNQY